MSVFPIEIFNKANQPKGFVEFGAFGAETVPGDQLSVLSVRAMQSRLDTQKSAITTVEFRSRHCIQAADSGIKVAAVTDPFGNRFGVIENPHFDLASVR